VGTKYSVVNTTITVLYFSDVYTFLHSTHQYTSQGLYPFGSNRSRLVCFCMTVHTTETLKKLKKKIRHHHLFMWL